ncbi:MAG: replication factor C large subunit [Candidatus Diapherotrites archaeon]|nr:replication factor C large subunit [Candidatus Diapherotrites archaeon]
MPELWTDKYFPKSLSEFIGNSEIVGTIDKWANGWNSGKQGKPLLLYGQTGSGKTALAHLIARINGWQIFELNASDFRTKEIIERLAGAAALNASFSGKPRLVLLDEIDGLQSSDKGGAAAIVNVLKQSQNPVMLTANEIYSEKKLAPIRAVCTPLEFRKINYLSIANYLKKICNANALAYEDLALAEIAKNCSGDLRSALLDLQTLAISSERITLQEVSTLSYRERQEKIFSILAKVFNAQSISEARSARFSSEVDTEMLQNWIEENIPRAYADANDIASAYRMLSRADIYEGRIRKRQHYGFLKYSSELATSGVALSKSQKIASYVRYEFPQFLKKLSAGSSQKALRKSLSGKMAEQMHSGIKGIIREDLTYIKMLFENKANAINLAAQFDFDAEEVAFLLSTKPETKKVQAIIGEAQKIRGRHAVPGKQLMQESGIAEPAHEQEEIPKPVAESGQRKLF